MNQRRARGIANRFAVPDSQLTTAMARNRRPVWAIAVLLLGLLLLVAACIGVVTDRSRGDDATLGRSPTATKVERVIPITPRRVPTVKTEKPRRAEAARAPSTTTVPPAPPPAPVDVRIPVIGVSSPLIRLGLNPDNTLQVPDDYGTAGWYIYRPVPGEVGPSIIAGHVDSKEGPGVFYRLGTLNLGDIVEVDRSDGSIARFVVTAKEQHDKDAFPTARVYGPTPDAQIRLITCGGTFDHSTGHYNDNIIVFGALKEIVRV
jgi:sortase (surface protein transpeptidase)